MSFVLVHGGGFAASCWDRLVPLLPSPTLAVDLPGRGERPARLDAVFLDDFVDAVVADIDKADLRDVVLVGHSLAGITLPGVVARIPDRLARVVFVACTVPADGERILDTLDPGIRALAERGREGSADEPLAPAVAEAVFCNDMDRRDTAYTLGLMVPETSNVIFEPVSLDGLVEAIPASWVLPTRDAIVRPEDQRAFAARVGADIVEIDAGHMVMISRPADLAEILMSCGL